MDNLPIIEEKTQDEIQENQLIKPKRKIRWLRVTVLFLILAVATPLAWVGAEGLAAFKNISVKNFSRRSPFLAFLNTVNPEKLEGEGDSRINILVLGMGGNGHPGGSLTDTIIIASIDPKNKEMALLSIPRDLYAPIAEHKNRYGKINEAYSLGEQQEKGTGPTIAKETVAEILDLPIHYFISVDFKGFVALVDSLGGLTVEVENNIYDPFFPAPNMKDYAPFYLKAGTVKMDGKLALKYVRSRKTSSDFDRSRRQQEFLNILKERALRLGILANPKKISDILEIGGEHIKTDLSGWEMKRMIEIVKDIEFDKVISKVLDNSENGPLISTSGPEGYYLKPKTGNFLEIQRIAHEIFSDPYLENEKANLEIVNANGKKGLGSEIAEMLKSYGYSVTKMERAEEILPETVIYDYSGGKKEYTLKFLRERFDAKVIKKQPQKNSNIEISLIIGEDYFLDARGGDVN